jgi:hypothetical protein
VRPHGGKTISTMAVPGKPPRKYDSKLDRSDLSRLELVAQPDPDPA